MTFEVSTEGCQATSLPSSFAEVKVGMRLKLSLSPRHDDHRKIHTLPRSVLSRLHRVPTIITFGYSSPESSQALNVTVFRIQLEPGF